ncbi:type IV pilus modification PilV family protein [Tepidibacter thalassicus]|nr:type II secretion system protein [Tepidibacter thalassicus]
MVRLNKNRGFTLIEIILSLVIIEIIVFSFVSIFLNCFILSLKSNEKLKALNLAQKYIEKMKVENADELMKNYNDKSFIEGKYIVDTILEVTNSEFDVNNYLKLIVKVKKDSNEILNLQSYKNIR